jgi:hypothetical protein
MMPEERYAEDGQEEEETTSDKFYYSMEELFRHKDTSIYEYARNRQVSEPTAVYWNPRVAESESVILES